jgi:hypothetical protein
MFQITGINVPSGFYMEYSNVPMFQCSSDKTDPLTFFWNCKKVFILSSFAQSTKVTGTFGTLEQSLIPYSGCLEH